MRKILFFVSLTVVSATSFAQSLLMGTSTSNTGIKGSVFNFYAGTPGFNNVYNVNDVDGWLASGIYKAPDGRFLATGYDGGTGDVGAIVQVNPYLQTNTILAEFTGGPSSGAYPQGGLVTAGDGNIYGMCKQGGANGVGCIYKFDPTNNTITIVHDLATITGDTPLGGLIEANGKLYGLTSAGGVNGDGVIFSYDYSVDGYNVLYHFDALTGSMPMHSFTLASNGNLYATYYMGGASNKGGIVKLDLPSETTTTFQFTSATDPKYCSGGLIEYLGDLYGTSLQGGMYDYGSIFLFNLSSELASISYSFDNTATNGGKPTGTPLHSVYDGKMYGVAMQGGLNGVGCIYQFDPDLTSYTKLTDMNTVVGDDFGALQLVEYHPFTYNGMTLLNNDPCNDGNCEGIATIGAYGGTGPYTYMWLPSGETTDTAVALCAGTHTVQVTEPGGGVITHTIDITTPAAPLNITATQTAPGCAGSSSAEAVSVATGGTPPYNYTWSNAVNDDTLTGLGNQFLTAYVGDANGCGANTGIAIVEHNTYIFGHISTATDDSVALNSGYVYLFKHHPGSTGFDTIDIAGITPDGDYGFWYADSSDFLIKAILDTPYYPLAIPTYYGNAFQWDSSIVVHHGCTVNDTINIQVMEVDTTVTGPGFISGYIVEGNDFGGNRIFGQGTNPNIPFSPGGPLKGVDVKLGKNPGGGIQARTMSDSTGYYEFTDLPLQGYVVYVDIPNLPMDSTHFITLDVSNSNSVQNNYFADSANIYINPNAVVGIHSSQLAYENNFKVFPNPAQDELFVSFDLDKESNVNIELCNSMGQVILSEKISNSVIGNNIHKVNLQTPDLKTGVYFISVISDKRKYTQRLVVID